MVAEDGIRMTKKCDYLGCKEKAKVFGKKSYCMKHAEEKGLIGQTNFGFPDTLNKLAEYQRKRNFSKTPEPRE